MLINTVIIDDENHSLDLLNNYCQQLPQLKVLSTFTDPLMALSFINNNNVDLLITDINMPLLSGIDLKESLPDNIATIIVTAHSEYAVQSFNLDVVDYLLKPVLLPRFIKAVNKASAIIKINIDEKNSVDKASYTFVKDGSTRKRINFTDILYIQAQGDYLSIHLVDSRLMILHTLSDFLALLPSDNFVRIHRSTILNLAKVDYVDKDHCVIQGVDLSIGKTFRTKLLKSLDS